MGDVVVFSAEELGLLSEALDSHIYWQLSDDSYRDSGYVQDPGSDDPEAREQIVAAERLIEKINRRLADEMRRQREEA